MPIAALADIHGNVHALRAVLADDRLAAADRIVVLGDVVAGTFPVETLELGTVRCCHATPDDEEAILTRSTPARELAASLAGIEERVVIGGHTHVQFDRTAGRHRYVNVGSVGRPCESRPGAYWTLLGPDVELLRTEYDVDEAAAAVLASGQPSAERVAAQLVDPPSPDDWTAQWEALRSSRTPRLP